MRFVTSFMKASSNPLHETDQTKTHFPSLSLVTKGYVHLQTKVSQHPFLDQTDNEQRVTCFDVKRNICYVHVKV